MILTIISFVIKEWLYMVTFQFLSFYSIQHQQLAFNLNTRRDLWQHGTICGMKMISDVNLITIVTISTIVHEPLLYDSTATHDCLQCAAKCCQTSSDFAKNALRLRPSKYRNEKTTYTCKILLNCILMDIFSGFWTSEFFNYITKIKRLN